MFFKCKIADKTYELDKLTLGEARVLKRDFGLSDLAFFSSTDPDVIVGLLALSLMRADDKLSLAEATAQAEALDIEEFDANPDAGEEDAEDADPTKDADADDAAATASRKSNGKSGKTR